MRITPLPITAYATRRAGAASRHACTVLVTTTGSKPSGTFHPFLPKDLAARFIFRICYTIIPGNPVDARSCAGCDDPGPGYGDDGGRSHALVQEARGDRRG